VNVQRHEAAVCEHALERAAACWPLKWRRGY
jgi:hypothetical protein